MEKLQDACVEHTELKEKLDEANSEIRNLCQKLEEKDGATEREQLLAKQNVELRDSFQKLENTFNAYASQFQSTELDTSKQRRAEETRCMTYESEIGQLLRHMETSHNEMKRTILEKERELKLTKDVADEASRVSSRTASRSEKVAKAYERSLMECEDRLAAAAKFSAMLKIEAAKATSLVSAPGTFSEYDVVDVDDLNSVREALQLEKDKHAKTK
ncbi:unnamed protein product, partial [Symbiodinium microadriaticum]